MALLNKYAKTYSSISELPMYNWLEITKGNMGFLFLKYQKPRKIDAKRLTEAWTKIYDQYIEKVGLTEDYIDLLEAMRKCTIAICRNALTPSSLNATREAEARDILDKMTSGEAGKFSEFVALVEKYMGFRLDLKDVSVESFYSYVGIMKKESEAIPNG